MNTLVVIVGGVFGINTSFVSAEQFWNAWLPIAVTELGIVIDVSLEQ